MICLQSIGPHHYSLYLHCQRCISSTNYIQAIIILGSSHDVFDVNRTQIMSFLQFAVFKAESLGSERRFSGEGELNIINYVHPTRQSIFSSLTWLTRNRDLNLV